MDRGEPRRLDMTTATTTTTTRRPRALLLDDDVTVLRLLGTALEARGFDVRAATDGESGLSLLFDELLELDVVVSALELPRRSGRSLVELIRKSGGERDLGLVLLGGGTDDATKAELLRLGADAVVERSSGPGAVASLVEAVAGFSRLDLAAA
jgi:chemosensory pili system protein ChpA (sensor histidine kinase/response regulator)